MGRGQRRGVARAVLRSRTRLSRRVPLGSGVRCGAGRGGAAHSAETRRRKIRGIMRKRLDAQRR